MAPKELTKIVINESDGVDTVYPDNLTKEVGSDGSYQYFRPVQEGEAKDLLWRTKTAKALVDKYGIAQPGKEYIFKSLPANYRLYEHVKGKKDSKERTDTYLFGHPSGKRFRSPAEFQVHIYHLAALSPSNAGGDAAKENAICACWICAGSKPGPGAHETPNRRSGAQVDMPAVRREIAAEERLGEQESSGWLLRKGEVVWVWVPDEGWDEDEDSPQDGKGGQWAAGVVRAKPTINVPIKRAVKTGGSSFADIDMDDTPMWQQNATIDEQTYTIQLCSGPKAEGQILKRVPQHRVRPWLARPEYVDPPPSYSGRREHMSVPYARIVVATFSLFDRNKGEYESRHEGEVLTAFGGIFLGAEKIFEGEPVRIQNPDDNLSAEDVLVVQNIYTSTRPSSKVGTDGKPKTTTITLLNGQVYTTSRNATPVNPQQFAELPFRMRREDRETGEIIKWCIRNHPDERGEVSLKLVLGRWYEPVAVNEWMRHSSELQMQKKSVDRWVADRMVALADINVKNVDLKNDDDFRKPEDAVVAERGSGTPADGGDPMDVDEPGSRVTPEPNGFKSVNLPFSTPRRESGGGSMPGSGGRSRMAMAAQDDDIDEESEDQGVAALGRSPTKRMAYR